MTPPDRPPFLHQIASYPGYDFGAQPGDVDRGVVASRVLAFCICGARHIDYVDEGIGMPQVVEEFVAQTLAGVGAGDESGYIEEFDWHGPQAVGAGAVVGFTPVLEAESGAGALDLEVAYCALGIDCCEAGERGSAREWLFEGFDSTYGKFPADEMYQQLRISHLVLGHVGMYQPTFDVASVSELSVLDLPALGLPTRPIRGSRGIINAP
jgi:hypothetical protein